MQCTSKKHPALRMKQIVGIWGGAGNSQSALVRSYVLYFERLAGWAQEGQGAEAGPVRGSGPMRGRRGRRKLKQGLCRIVARRERETSRARRVSAESSLKQSNLARMTGGVFRELSRRCRRACLRRNSQDCGCDTESLCHEDAARL